MGSILEGKTDRCWLESVKRCAATRELVVLFLEVWGEKKEFFEKWFGCGTSNLSAVKNLMPCGCANVQPDGALPNFILHSFTPSAFTLKHINLPD